MADVTKKPRKPSQSSSVLDYLKSGKPLTSLQAISKFGCTRLPARIADYQKCGYLFSTEWIEGKNMYGYPTRYKKYKLIGKAD